MSCAWAGLVDWRIPAEYLVGGALLGWIGARSATRLGRRKEVLNDIFIGVIIMLAIYMLWKEIG